MSKSFFQKLSPASLARGLWGRGPVPTRYKVLFLGQGLIFSMAIWIRTQDVARAQQIKQLQMAEEERQKIEGGVKNGSSENKETLSGDR